MVDTLKNLTRCLLLVAMLLIVTAPVLAQESGRDLSRRDAAIEHARNIEQSGDEFQMVLIHGLGANATEWDDVLPFLKNTFNVRIFELAGHGLTKPVVDDTITKEVARLAEFIAAQNFNYPTLVGHGMGGMIALQYTLDHPANVHRLIIMDSAPVQLASQEEKAAVGEQLIADYDRFVASRYLNMSTNETISDRAVDMALRTDSATFVSLLMSSFDYDMTARLNSLSVPMLIIGSEMMFPAAQSSQQLLEYYGFAHAHSLSFKRMANTGHLMMLEQPIMTASVLLAFGVTAEYTFDN